MLSSGLASVISRARAWNDSLVTRCESTTKRDPTSDTPQLLDTLKGILFRVGSRSAPIGTPTSGVLADDFSDLLLFWPGSRFGADSQLRVCLPPACLGTVCCRRGAARRTPRHFRQPAVSEIAIHALISEVF